MIKDITLGQFFPGKSFIHLLDPRVKLLLSAVYIVSLFSARGLTAYALNLVWLLAAFASSKLNVRVIFKGLRPLVLIMAVTSALNIFYTPGREVWSWGPLTASAEGFQTAGCMIVRLVMLVSATFLLTYTTSPMTLTDALERVLAPLKKIKAPVHEFAMMITIALRFIPTLIEETDKIMSAQKARGADFESGRLISRAKALTPLLVPLFVSAFRRADELAVAMECRCYNGGGGRTRMRVLRCQKRDAAAVCVTLIVAAATVAFSALGFA